MDTYISYKVRIDQPEDENRVVLMLENDKPNSGFGLSAAKAMLSLSSHHNSSPSKRGLCIAH